MTRLRSMYFAVVQISTALFVAVTAGSVCPDGWTDAGGYCYNFTTGLTLSWDNAQAACVQDGGHLIVEASEDEHVAFVSYRQSLPQQGDPLWVGVRVQKQGIWSWLSDSGISSILYQNWKDGKMPAGDLGRCVATSEYNLTEAWVSMPCVAPLSFVCEATPRNPQVPGGGYTFSKAEYFRDWKKIYEDSTFHFSNVVVNANMARTRSLVSCAVTCTTVTGCTAFNHRRLDNTCQFILSNINDTYVSTQSGWDVWIDMSTVS